MDCSSISMAQKLYWTSLLIPRLLYLSILGVLVLLGRSWDVPREAVELVLWYVIPQTVTACIQSKKEGSSRPHLAPCIQFLSLVMQCIRPLLSFIFILIHSQVVSQMNPTTGKIYHASVNACLAPLVSVDGKHVITVEGIGNVKAPHPAQERIAMSSGSQCGFCTPGIVMV